MEIDKIREQIKQELIEITYFLEKLNYKYLFPICGGLMYSMFKFNHKLNPDDMDLDFHIKREHTTQFYDLIKTMESNGYYTKYKYYNSDKQLSELTIVKKGFPSNGIDFNFIDKENDYYKYTCYIGVDTPVEIVKFLPMELYDNLVLDNIESSSLYRPENYDLYLTIMYRDWITGRKDYQYWNPEHAGNIIEIRKWDGKAIVSLDRSI
jgi:phosphorylcholine metabolism protein LicD